MRPATILCLVAFASAGCGKDSGSSSSSSSSPSSSSSSNVKHIPGGSEQKFQGLVFDLPSNWRTQSQDGKMGLVPEGANASGMLEEAYVLASDPSATSIEGADADRKIAELVGPGATKKSGPDSKKFGDVEGRVWVYTAPAQGGQSAEVRLYALKTSPICALVALGLPDKIAKRDRDLDAILASMSKAAPSAGGTTSGGIAQELCGKWIWFSSLTANNGGGSQTNTWIILDASGRYKWHYDSVSTNPNGGAWGSEDETGTWSSAEGSISFRPDRGNPYTQALVKRNHPKNVGDPMIVLDGKPYVTATNRQPW